MDWKIGTGKRWTGGCEGLREKETMRESDSKRTGAVAVSNANARCAQGYPMHCMHESRRVEMEWVRKKRRIDAKTKCA